MYEKLRIDSKLRDPPREVTAQICLTVCPWLDMPQEDLAKILTFRGRLVEMTFCLVSHWFVTLRFY